MAYIGRFAPSPTGDLHWGSLLAALGSWLEARAAGGRWLLRIEDVDTPRSVPGADARQLARLQALGLHADAVPLWQSTRGEAYTAALRQLVAGGHAYPCACSRGDLAAHGGIHPARCVRRARDDGSCAWRLRVPPGTVRFEDGLQGRQEQDVRASVGDFVLRRADGLWAYQLAVVVDDAAGRVSDVVRGADLLDSTPRQIVLQRQLGLPTPRYLHLPVVIGGDGEKLSKSAGAEALPDDPLQTLRTGLLLLGQMRAARGAARSVDGLLQYAVQHFHRADLPSTPWLAAPQSPAQ